MAKGKGRRKGSRNRGYFYRAGRGWFAKLGSQYVPLEYENGDRMRSANTPLADVKAAYRRRMAEPIEESPAVTVTVLAETADPAPEREVTVLEVCTAYLDKAKDGGAEATYENRQRTLFDFCFGLPSRFIADRPKSKPTPKPAAADRIHKGFGQLKVSDLRPIHLDKWLQAHPNWKGGRRTKIQAVKRALNYAVEAGLIDSNPIKGYKTPKQNARVTYITTEQEKAVIDAASPALAMAIQVCIRTGARPGCEFAQLTAKHVTDHGDKMEWTFQPHESKTGELRIIRIVDADIIAIVRKQIEKHPSGPIFRQPMGGRWRRPNLSEKFRYTKAKLIKKGIEFDADCCMYSCRHTYAKRVLQGYWSGKPTNIETLARLMGNSPQICHTHYLQWTDSYAAPLWESA